MENKMQKFEEFFSKSVRNINTRNVNWKKECTHIIYSIMDRFLANEVVYNNIINYDLKIERIGQSKINCICTYKEKYYKPSITINIQERVKSPKEICNSLLLTAELAYCKLLKN